MGDGASYVLIYDGECGVCRRSVGWVRKGDVEGRIETVPYQDPSVPERFPDIPRERLEAAMQLLGPDGARWEGARAAEVLLTLLPRWRLLGALFRIPGARRIAEVVYRGFAARRRRFGCGEHCAAPEGGEGDGASTA